MTDESNTPKRTNPNLEPTDDFTSAYANHTFLEPSTWDLKMIFGQLDQSVQPNVVEQHTAITIPWTQAKILSHFLRVHLAAYEIVNGKIALHRTILPPEPTHPTKEILEQEPKSQEVFEMLKVLHKELIESA
jgi:hypothetical protein